MVAADTDPPETLREKIYLLKILKFDVAVIPVQGLIKVS